MFINLDYIMLCLLWGAYAVRRQVKLHGWSKWRIPLVAILNIFFCPFCMIWAIVKGE